MCGKEFPKSWLRKKTKKHEMTENRKVGQEDRKDSGKSWTKGQKVKVKDPLENKKI